MKVPHLNIASVKPIPPSESFPNIKLADWTEVVTHSFWFSILDLVFIALLAIIIIRHPYLVFGYAPRPVSALNTDGVITLLTVSEILLVITL